MMRERREIVRLWREGGSIALATLVAVRGSSYRRAGARLLIAQGGRYAGAISGGCMEAELLKKATWYIRNGPVVKTFSTAFDDAAEMPFGLGCGGTVDVLLESSDTDSFNALMLAMEASLHGNVQCVRTWLPRGKQSLDRQINATTLPAYGDFIEEVLLPPQRLVICGAGDDALPLCSLASLLGWDAVVVDGRAQWARAERFAEAQEIELVSEPCSFRLNPSDAVVVMTHSFTQDRDWLFAALPIGVRYLGLLGARHRSALLISDAAAALGWDVARICRQIFTPVGLDLGGDGAESIALAIVAEIHAHIEGKPITSQRLTAETVVELAARFADTRELQSQCAL
jgi:xanthine dehydrogenase accessory factor